MYLPVADEVMRRGKGTTCILTQTNEEAVVMLALLNGRGVKAKLIQSLDGLRFCNLMEMRYFMKCVNSRKVSPLIAEEAWEEAKLKRLASMQQARACSMCADVWRCLS